MTILSKILSFMMFLILGKELTEINFGQLVYVNLIISYIPMMQIGLMNGAAVLIPKHSISSNESVLDYFNDFNISSLLLHSVSFIFLLIPVFELDTTLTLIILVDLFFKKLIENLNLYLRSLLKLQRSIYVKVFDELLRVIIVLSFFMYNKSLRGIFEGHLIASILTFFLILYLVPEYNFRFFSRQYKVNLREVFNIGFLIYISWLFDLLFRSLDKILIKGFMSIEDLAIYGFCSSLAINIWVLSLSYFSPYAQLLYRLVVEERFLKADLLIKKVNRFHLRLLTLAFVGASLFYPLITKYFVKKYDEAYFTFIILLAAFGMLSRCNMYIYYMNCNRMQKKIIKHQLVIICINIILNLISAYYFRDIFYFSIATLVSALIYYKTLKVEYNNEIRRRLEAQKSGL
ncbi:lipopolysaccharide biosynthesis protein [Halobacteriovorax sp. YZS-1-1]|uniref:lipopolysaccharide biosynthesis protein n=1 Tax=unclassified Halobacteriovorax TaxID=2639665 RepID=UPI00399A9A6C